MPVFYVTNKKPLSHNKGGSREEYKQAFRDEFKAKYANLYSGLPYEKIDCNLALCTYIN